MSIREPTDPSAADAERADFVARAETDRDMLERLAVIGMRIAEEIGERAVNSPYHPEARHEPGRAFANVSRAIRFTIVLRGRIDRDILAVRNGKAPLPEPPIDPRRARIRAGVWSAINREVRDKDTAMRALDRVHESLIEREDYDELLDRPWRECVEAICADLGLDPDWGLWSDDTGFPEIRGWPRRDWTRTWSYDPERAEEDRRRRSERPPAAPGTAAERQLEDIRSG